MALFCGCSRCLFPAAATTRENTAVFGPEARRRWRKLPRSQNATRMARHALALCVCVLLEVQSSPDSSGAVEVGDASRLARLPACCGKANYSSGAQGKKDAADPTGWSSTRHKRGMFARPLQLRPCGPGGGGWRCAVDDESSTIFDAVNGSIATLTVNDVEALQHFEDKYRNREPLLIKASKGNHAWLGKGQKARRMRQKFHRKSLLKSAGGSAAKVGLSHDIVIFQGRGYVDYTVRDYIETFMPEHESEDAFEGEPFYIFQRVDPDSGIGMDWVPKIHSLLTPPNTDPKFELFNSKTCQMCSSETIWMIGPPRSGTAWHDHHESVPTHPTRP